MNKKTMDYYVEELENIETNIDLISNNIGLLNKYLMDLNNSNNKDLNELQSKIVLSKNYVSLAELIQMSIENTKKDINKIIKELL